MFKTNVLKIAPSFKWSLVEKMLTKSAEITSHTLYIFSEERMNPDIISKIYQRPVNPDLYLLCSGLPLHDYTGIDDIDLYLSPCMNDQQSLSEIQSKFLHWRRTKFMHLSIDDYEVEQKSSSCAKLYKYGVLGGTFDDLHIGHKLLLTTASTVCTDKLLIGVTHEDLLKKKKMVELLQPYVLREQNVKDFLNIINPTIDIEIVPISDPIGPAGTNPDLDVLIVSKETQGGIDMINNIRRENSLRVLDSLIVDLVFPSESSDKLSSSSRRKELLGKIVRKNGDEPWLRRLKGNKSIEHTGLPYTIGLTGGICSGKSTISSYLKEKGVETIDCDKIAHRVYEPSTPAYEELVKEFGPGIVDSSTFIDRKALGGIVFKDPAKMQRLNEIVWPRIAEYFSDLIREMDTDVVVVEAAVMLEAGWDAIVDEVWVMTVSPDEAIKRLTERNKLSIPDAERRLSAQMSNSMRCAKADVIICSDWEPSYTQSVMEKAWVEFQDRLKYYKICQECSTIEARWKLVASEVCEEPCSDGWLEAICRSEKSKSFLDIALETVDETLHLAQDKHFILYTAFFFLSTTLHVKNSSPRAYEAMFKMFCQGNTVKKDVADEIMKNIKVSSSLQKKSVACSNFTLLFRDIWMKAALFCLDEGDQRILPSVFTTEDVKREQESVQCELLLRLCEGSKFTFKTEYFRGRYEGAAQAKIKTELSKLTKLDEGVIMNKVRKNIGYSLQEY